jgi:hypothetical protein
MREEDRALSAALEERLRAAGLGRVVAEVLELARLAIRLDLTRAAAEGDILVGATKVGGTADLPPDVAWPEWRGGPLPFIAQVRLEEVAELDPEGDLPHRGLLSFFYMPNDPDLGLRVEEDPTAWRVLYTEDTARVERRPLPRALAAGLEMAYPACAVTCSRRLTLPSSMTEAVQSLRLSEDEQGAYSDIVSGESAGFETEMDHRLLGYPYVLGPYPFLAGYLARSGIERPVTPENPRGRERRARALNTLQEAARQWRAPAEGASLLEILRITTGNLARVNIASVLRATRDMRPTPAPPEYQARMDELQRAAEQEWRLLLQVYSNEEAEMDWAGGGVIHFGIARVDLVAHGFSQVWVDLDVL